MLLSNRWEALQNNSDYIDKNNKRQKMNKSPSFLMTDLPRDLLFLCFSMLDQSKSEFLRLSLTCKSLNKSIRDFYTNRLNNLVRGIRNPWRLIMKEVKYLQYGFNDY